MADMRVVVIEHESGAELVCRDAGIAVETVAECLAKQAHRAVADREEIKVRYETMTRKEWESLPETDSC